MTLNRLQYLLPYCLLHLHYLRLLKNKIIALLLGMLLVFMGSIISLGYSPQALAESKPENVNTPYSSDKTLQSGSTLRTLRIVTTVEPYRLIAKAALKEIAPSSQPSVEFTTLITQPISAHHFSLKPSQRIALKQADVVIVSRLADEPMLEKSIAKTNATIIDVSTLKDLIRYTARNEHTHRDSDSNYVQAKESYHHKPIEDTHFWFEPHNAALIGIRLLEILKTKYPEKKSAFAQASIQFQQKITQQQKIWQRQLEPLQNQRFLMFHDAYQYLEQWAEFKQSHWLTETDEHLITPKNWIEIERMLQNKEIDCIIASTESTEAFQKLQYKYGAHFVKNILIDDIARDFQYDLTRTPPPSSDQTYFDWIDWLVQSLLQCAPTQT